eukprot:527253-Prymnesium_polylepis.1
MHGDLKGLLLDLQQLRGVPAVLGRVPVEVGRPAERVVRAVAVVALSALQSKELPSAAGSRSCHWSATGCPRRASR